MFTDDIWRKLILSFTQRLRKAVGNTFDAEDLVQDSLMVTLLNSHQIQNDKHLHFYLQKVGKNQLANYQRRKQKERRKVSDDGPDSAPSDQSQPDDAYDYKELVNALKEVACSLKPRERTLLEMMISGSSPDEICQAMGIDAKSRNLLAFRLKQKLKKKLAKKGYRLRDAHGK